MKQRLLVHFSYVTASRYLAECLFLVRGLVVAHLLGPAVFGIWSAMRLLTNYSNLVQLGARDGMLQHAPYADAVGDHGKARLYRGVTSAINLVAAPVAACAASVVLAVQHPDGMTSWWLLFACLLALNQAYRFNQRLLNSQRKFPLSSSLAVLFSVLSTASGIFGAWQAGLNGFLTAIIFSYTITIGAAIIVGPPHARPTWSPAIARELIGTGLPILAATLLMVLLWSVDRLLIWILLGEEDLGIYSIQSYFTAAMLLLPNAVASVLRPHLMTVLGSRTTGEEFALDMEKSALLFARVILPITGITCLLLHLPIRWLLPDYSAAIEPGRILVFFAFVSMLGTIPSNYLIALGRQKTLLVIRSLAVVITVIAVTYTLLQGGGYGEVAISTGLGLITSTILVMTAAFRALATPARRRLRYAGWNSGFVVVLAAALALAWWFLPDRPVTWQQDLVNTAGRCIVLLIATAPLFIPAIRRISGIQPR
jgi:O-antigen/teichoic acid export membrane protein